MPGSLTSVTTVSKNVKMELITHRRPRFEWLPLHSSSKKKFFRRMKMGVFKKQIPTGENLVLFNSHKWQFLKALKILHLETLLRMGRVKNYTEIGLHNVYRIRVNHGSPPTSIHMI